MITKVQLNVLVICICYFARFVYDLFKTLWYAEFVEFRMDSFEPPDHYYYAIFYFFLVMVVEFMPIMMYSVNMSYISSRYLDVHSPSLPWVYKTDEPVGERIMAENRVTVRDKRSVLSDDVYYYDD
jgi:hypothetical protein